jgi:hypothetical protein
MKKEKLLILAVTVIYTFMSSCIITPHIQHYEYTYVADLTKYSEENFLFLKEGYQGKHESCGFVEGALYPEVVKEPRTVPYDESKYHKYGYWLVEKISVERLIDNVYKEAKHLNANALIHFKIVKVTNPEIYRYSEFTNQLKDISDGYYVSGFAIRRIE